MPSPARGTGPRRRLAGRLLAACLLTGRRPPRRTLAGGLAAARRVGGRAHAVWRTPGTRLGFWVHFSCMSLTTMFSVLWGLPYLVAQGFSPAGASAVLLVCVLAAIALSPAVGMVFGRFPAAGVPFAAGVCLVTVAGWAILLGGFGGRPPHALIVVVVTLMAAGGPASTIGFSLARDYNAHTAVGTASGVVNVGGFSAAILASLLVGGLRRDPATDSLSPTQAGPVHPVNPSCRTQAGRSGARHPPGHQPGRDRNPVFMIRE